MSNLFRFTRSTSRHQAKGDNADLHMWINVLLNFTIRKNQDTDFRHLMKARFSAL